MLIGEWGREYNEVREHRSLGYQSLVPEAVLAGETTQ